MQKIAEYLWVENDEFSHFSKYSAIRACFSFKVLTEYSLLVHSIIIFNLVHSIICMPGTFQNIPEYSPLVSMGAAADTGLTLG